jgi:hypothetical protein
MPAWILSIQGIREILNSAGTALTRRKQLQFGEGFTASDDGTRTVVVAGAPSAAQAAAMAAAVRGPGLTVTSAGTLKTRKRPRRVDEDDFFSSGGLTSGLIGKMNWGLFGVGTPSLTRTGLTIDSPSRMTLATSAAANDRSVVKLNATSESADSFIVTNLNVLQCVINHNATLTNKRFFFGFHGNFATEPSAASDCLGIYYDSAVSPNYQIIARNGGVGSPVVTASVVPSNTGQILTLHQSAAGAFDFRVGNTLVGTISSGLPTASVDIGFRVETLTTASTSFRFGYVGYSGDVASVFDDDTFLEA